MKITPAPYDIGITGLNSEQQMAITMISSDLSIGWKVALRSVNGGFRGGNFGCILLQREKECHLSATGWNKA